MPMRELAGAAIRVRRCVRRDRDRARFEHSIRISRGSGCVIIRTDKERSGEKVEEVKEQGSERGVTDGGEKVFLTRNRSVASMDTGFFYFSPVPGLLQLVRRVNISATKHFHSAASLPRRRR